LESVVKTIVLLSGGIDSTVLLAHHVCKGYDVTAISFLYGQSHAKEVDSAKEIAAFYGVSHHITTLSMLGDSALTGQGKIPDGHAESVDATYVPGRNILMLAVAIGFAERLEAHNVSFGANKDDFNGYPDCRPDFVDHMDLAASLSSGVSVTAPFMKMTKRQVVEYGHQLCAPLDLSWSCYRGGNEPCGSCGACISRIEAA
jgi:7-cyano-7-deazaguanine synthase